LKYTLWLTKLLSKNLDNNHALIFYFHVWRDYFKPYKDFKILHTMFSLPLTIKPSHPCFHYIYIYSKISPLRKIVLIKIHLMHLEIWIVAIVNTIQVDSICATRENVSLKSILSTCEEPQSHQMNFMSFYL